MTDWNKILEQAKDETKKELMEDIQDVSILNEKEINSIAPLDSDKAKLRELFRTVADAETQINTVVRELSDNSDIIVKLIKTILKKNI